MPTSDFNEQKTNNPGTNEPATIQPVASKRFLEPDRVASLICTAGIIGCFWAPWVNRAENNSAASLALEGSSFSVYLWIVPIVASFNLVAIRQSKHLRSITGSLTAIVAMLGVAYVALLLGPSAIHGSRWGAFLTLVFASALFAVSGDQCVSAPFDFVAKKLGSRKSNAYSHTITVPRGIHFSTQAFYATIEAAVKAKQWPGVEVFRINYTEAGFLLSHKREYLRILRQRHLFDICASTFGQDYFFSVRETEIPAVLDPRVFVALMIVIAVLITLVLRTLGLLFGASALLFLGLFIIWFFFNVLKMGLTKVDGVLLRLPIIGPVYEAWFRPDTYFQQDTRFVFLYSVNELVKETVEETVSAKGLKLLDLFERHPVLNELYERSRRPLQPTAHTDT